VYVWWWIWVVGGLALWLVVGLIFALVVGRGISLADERSPGTGVSSPLTTEGPLASFAGSRADASLRRGAVPLPTVGVALVVLVLALETGGYITRLTGASGTLADLLSMDAPYSVPRLFVAGVFATAAFAAVAGAGVHRGRRTWWLAVGLVAGGIAVVKAGSTMHADALSMTSAAIGSIGALLLSALLAAAVVGLLWFLSRSERRDRRRVLGALSFYAVAVVGLSAVSGTVAGSFGGGSAWAAAATFIEESGEALAGVAYLMAVLIGVAPRLVLPGAWALRREADASTLELPGQLPGPSAADLPMSDGRLRTWRSSGPGITGPWLSS
jgi:hypothetical protein